MMETRLIPKKFLKLIKNLADENRNYKKIFGNVFWLEVVKEKNYSWFNLRLNSSHELCHLFEMNHSSRFWALVARFCPDYKKSRILMRAGYAHLFVIMDELRKRNFITYGFGSKILASTKDNVLCMSPECNEKWKRRAE